MHVKRRNFTIYLGKAKKKKEKHSILHIVFIQSIDFAPLKCIQHRILSESDPNLYGKVFFVVVHCAHEYVIEYRKTCTRNKLHA